MKMFRKNTPTRTLYNGPFVLPAHPSYCAPISLDQLLKLKSQEEPNSGNIAVCQQESNSEDACVPVYNFSFLNESASEWCMTQQHTLGNAQNVFFQPVNQSGSSKPKADYNRPISNNFSSHHDNQQTCGIGGDADLLPLEEASSLLTGLQGHPSIQVPVTSHLNTNHPTANSHFIIDPECTLKQPFCLQPDDQHGPMCMSAPHFGKWRKAKHGFVWEYKCMSGQESKDTSMSMSPTMSLIPLYSDIESEEEPERYTGSESDPKMSRHTYRGPRKRRGDDYYHEAEVTAQKQLRRQRSGTRYAPERDLELAIDRIHNLIDNFPCSLSYPDPYDDPYMISRPPRILYDEPYYPRPSSSLDTFYDLPPPRQHPLHRGVSAELLHERRPSIALSGQAFNNEILGRPDDLDFTADIGLFGADRKKRPNEIRITHSRDQRRSRGRSHFVGQNRSVGKDQSAVQGRPAWRGHQGSRGQYPSARGKVFNRGQAYGRGRLAERSQSAHGQNVRKSHLPARSQEGAHQAPFRGQGKGKVQTGKRQPPVSATQKAKVSRQPKPVVDPSNMTTEEKLHLFMAKLREFQDRENSIQTIENCMTGAHLNLKTHYDVEPVDTDTIKTVVNTPLFTGALYIENQFIARSTNSGKKLLKHAVYDKALILLRTRSVTDIMSLHDTGPEVDLCNNSELNNLGVEVKPNDLKSKLEKLQDKIMATKGFENQPVLIFEMAYSHTNSRCGLKRHYEQDAIKTDKGGHMYMKTRLYIEDKLLTTAMACSKIESKAKVCQKAVEMFCNRDVDDLEAHLLNSSDTEVEIPPETQSLSKKEMKKRKKRAEPPVILSEDDIADLLDKLIRDLTPSPKEGMNAVMIIDKNCVQLKLKLLVVYKNVCNQEEKHQISCDLYLMDRFIAQGIGNGRKQAQTDAYKNAVEILRTSKGIEILTVFPKFEEAELRSTEVVDIVYKGHAKTSESNLSRLNRLKQLPEEKRKVEELIIIEYEDWAKDRQKHAKCILDQSATQCGLLLEWTTEPLNGCFKCVMQLQGVHIGTAIARTKKEAVNLASLAALFKFYEKQPVVRGSHPDYPATFIPRSELVKLAETLAESGEASAEKSRETKSEVDPKIASAMKHMLDQFFIRPTLREFVPAPDWTLEERRHLRFVAGSNNFRIILENYCEEQLPVISTKYDLSQMVNILEKLPDKTDGRYCLLTDDEKPSYNDIAGEIAANDSYIRQHFPAVIEANMGKAVTVVDLMTETDMDLSAESEGNDVFVTANNTLNSMAKTPATSAQTTPAFTILNMLMPRSTSTPSRTETPVRFENGHSKTKNSKYKSSKEQPTKTPSSAANGAVTNGSRDPCQPSNSPTSSKSTSLAPVSSFQPSGTTQSEQPRKPSDPSPARLTDSSWSDSASFNNSGDMTEVAGHWGQLQQPQEQLQPQQAMDNQTCYQWVEPNSQNQLKMHGQYSAPTQNTDVQQDTWNWQQQQHYQQPAPQFQ